MCAHTTLVIKKQQRISENAQHLWCKLDIRKTYHISFSLGNKCAKYVHC